MFIDTTSDVANRITGAIREAARVTGAGFDYLLKTALRESNFDPEVKASTSSATGLFQFIDQTWLETMKTAGASVGYGNYADAISKTPSGKYVVADAAAYRDIMNLRTDPKASAVMAGAFTARNRASLSEALGRKPSDGELYIAHFLGPAGAARFIAAAEKSPTASAAEAFPDAARANRSIFYNRLGGARSLGQVYARLVKAHDATGPANVPTAPAAQAATATAAVSAASAAQTVAAVALPAPARLDARSGLPVFHDLFRGGGRGGVGEGVTALWGGRGGAAPVQLAAAVTPVSAAESSAQTGRIGAPLDLFRFLRPEIQGIVKRTL